MVVNFKAHEISRDAHKLTRTLTLIKKHKFNFFFIITCYRYQFIHETLRLRFFSHEIFFHKLFFFTFYIWYTLKIDQYNIFCCLKEELD
jgi:hypothetical protein